MLAITNEANAPVDRVKEHMSNEGVFCDNRTQGRA